MSILKELGSTLPKDASISEIKFEGSELVLYTKNKDFFRNSESVIRSIVSKLKKRIEVRPDLSITMDLEEAKKKIKEIVPEDAGIQEIYFEPELGKVVIECLKPGIVIGKGGETYKRIKSDTCWVPKIERAPVIKSDIVRAVRNLLHTEIDYRKRFLNKIGQKITTEKEAAGEWVRVSVLGGGMQVGRSCFLVQTPKSSVMMDCGIEPGSNEMPFISAPELDLENLDAICLSHSHLDHCASIPYLYENGYTGPLYCTAPTRDLMVLLCLDYIDVCQREGKEIWYSKKAVEKAVKHSVVLDYGEVSDITQDIRLTLHQAGHILGSSMIHLHIGRGLHNILYTGDFKFGPSRLLDPAFTDLQRVETLIIESTYGGKENVLPGRRETEERFLDLVNKTMKNGGKVLIPVFASGRAQEVMSILATNNFKYPVYLEGMLWDATAIHTAYPEYLSNYLQRSIFHYGKNPFVAEMFHRVAPKERNKIIESGEPCVILATSGMLIGGPSVEYLKALCHDKKNLLIFVGWQSPTSFGGKIQKGWKEVPITGTAGRTKTAEIKMDVETIHGLSCHSGRRQLVSFVHRLSSKPERILVNHGERKRVHDLANDLHRIFRVETNAPKNLDALRLK